MPPLFTPAVYHRRLRRWYHQNRRDLPWRRTDDPYAIAVSEVMLQQTQVDRVIPKYTTWLKRFPTTQSLAVASLSDVLKLWSGLGYNRRARMLRDAARTVMTDHHGRWPRTSNELGALPGFGPYTASAVAVFACGAHQPMVDTNVRRVLSRWRHGIRQLTTAQVEHLAERMLPSTRVAEWHHALMDFGATICRSRPRCPTCPMRDVCRAYPRILTEPRKPPSGRVTFHATNRYVRGRILQRFDQRARWTVPEMQRQLKTAHQITAERFMAALKQLVAEQMVEQRGRWIRLGA